MKKTGLIAVATLAFGLAASAALPQAALAAAPKIERIDSGAPFTALHKSDGSVWMIGNRNSVPVRLPNIGAGAVTVIPRLDVGRTYAFKDSLVLYGDGTVWSVPTDPAVAPARMTALDNIRQLAAGADYYLALKNDGTVWAWGRNYYGQLGNGRFDEGYTDAPTRVIGLKGIVRIEPGANFSLALADYGKVYTWGWWSQGGSIAFSRRDYARPKPLRVQGLPKAVDISIGFDLAMAVAEDGSVFTWGRNDLLLRRPDGKLPAFLQQPQRIEGLPAIAEVEAGPVSLYLARSGEVWQTGLDWKQRDWKTDENSMKPVKLANIANAVQVAATDGYRFVLDAAGNGFAWGGTDDGQLGTGKVGWHKSEPAPTPMLYPSDISVNGVIQPYSGVIAHGVTYVPLRDLAKRLGGKLGYVHQTKAVTLTKRGVTVTFVPGDSVVNVNGKEVALGGQIRNYDNATYVPLRFFSELFGAKVNWEAEAGLVTIATE